MPEVLPSVSMAKIDRQSGHAVIQEPSGKLYLVNIKDSKKLQDGEGVHVGLFFHSGITNLEVREAGEFPYAELISYVELVCKQEECLRMALMALDLNEGKAIRDWARRSALKSMRDADVENWLVERLTNIYNSPNQGFRQLLAGSQ
jgi:hypothetical protein